MSAQIIPLTSAQNQTLRAQLTVDGSSLVLLMFISYSAMSGYWELEISDVNGNILVASVPFVTGLYPAANMLAQYGYLKIGSAYLLNTGDSSLDYPGPNTLGVFSLLWGDTEV